MTGIFNGANTFSLAAIQAIQTSANEKYIDIVPDDNVLFQADFAGTTWLDTSDYSGHQLFGGNTIDGVYYGFPYDMPGSGLDLDHRAVEGGPTGQPGNANYFNYVMQTSTQNLVSFAEYMWTEIQTGLTIPGTDTTTALYQEFKKSDGHSGYSRNQYGQRTNNDGDKYQNLNQGYIKVKKYWHPVGINSPTSDWSLPFEWKQEGDRYGRFGLYISDPLGLSGEPYWTLKCQDAEYEKYSAGNWGWGDNFWTETNTTSGIVPEDEWYDIEVFWIGSSYTLATEDETHPCGRVQVAITTYTNGVANAPVLVFDVKDRTKGTVKDGNSTTIISQDSDHIPYYSSMGFKVYGVDGQLSSTDFLYCKEPIAGSILTGSGD